MKKTVLLLFTSFAGISLFAQTVKGKVIDEITQMPIPGAQVTFVDLGISTGTDSTGYFELFSNLPEFYRMSVVATGYETALFNSILSQDTYEFKLKEQHVVLDEVQIVASRGGQQKDVVTYVDNKKLSDLNAIKATNLGDAIANIPGVYTTTTGTGISKPVIRGLSGTRVITMLNGIRLENQQWGSDHGMGITALGIENVEVIKGPASLLYGTDALGGVLYFVDEKFAKNGTFEERIGSSFESNALNSQSNVALKYADTKIRVNVFAGFNSASDFQLPNKNYLVNSRYEDRLFKTAIGFGRKNWVSTVRYNYMHSYVGIPGETEDSIVTPLSFQSPSTIRKREIPFQRIENNIVSWENKFFFKQNELSINLGNTNNSLSEFEESATSPGLSMNLNSSLYTVKFRWHMKNGISWTNGVQGMFQLNRNNPNADEVLIPNSNTSDNGIFSIFDYRFGQYIVQAGIRGDIRSINVLDDSISFNKTYGSLNYSAGIVRKLEHSTIRLNVSTGYRAPHTSELLAKGAHDGALRYELGNRDLKTEQATQLDLTYEFGNSHISFILNPFYSHINNYIYIHPTDSIIGNYQVFEYGQADNVHLFGTDAGIHFHPHFAHWIHLETTYSYVRGEEKSGNSLPLIPQARINTNLKFAFEALKKAGLDNLVIQHSYYFAQKQVGFDETRTAAFNYLNAALNFSWSRHSRVDFSLGVKNILNATYINHLSSLKNIGIPQPGRNFYVSVVLGLEQRKR